MARNPEKIRTQHIFTWDYCQECPYLNGCSIDAEGKGNPNEQWDRMKGLWTPKCPVEENSNDR